MEGGEEDRRRSKGSLKIKRQSSKGGSVKNKKKDKSRTPPASPLPPPEPIEMLSPKQNGYVEGEDGEEGEEKQTASIKGMWKKAFKSLKSNDKQHWLSKKGSFKKKATEEESEPDPPESSKEIDPVYSLLKCAADLPKVPKSHKDCGGHLATSRGDSSGSTSKASSPSSSVPHSLSLPAMHYHAAARGNPTTTTPTSPTGGSTSALVTNRDHMHHIVDESLGSEFRTFYKLTSPVKAKIPTYHSHHHHSSHEGAGVASGKHSPRSMSFDHY